MGNIAGIYLWWLLVGHAVCDYPLQGDFLAKGKNHKTPLPGIPWWICLAAHALIHGGAVAMITKSVVLGMMETVLHIMIDWLKCDGRTSFIIDQWLHVVCKVIWAMTAAFVLGSG